MNGLSHVNLTALRASEAVFRLGGLRPAADELGVTPGAVSQQILKAEAQLGHKLFERTPKELIPTALGKAMSAHLTEGFTSLSRGVALSQNTHGNALTVSVAPVFAAKWLVRRLGDFAAHNPDIRVRIDTSVAQVIPEPGDVDACIRVGKGDWPGVCTEKILQQKILPVCAPSMAQRLTDVSSLSGVPIIREQSNRLFSWDTWLSPNGASKDLLGPGPVFSDASLCLDAAAAGQGVYLSLETLATDGIANGTLAAALPGRFSTDVAYWFVEPNGRRRPQVKAFRDWLFQELRRGPGNTSV